MRSATLLIAVLSWGLAGCGQWSKTLTNPIDKLSPYKMDIAQGNVLDQSMLSKLKPGMTRAQVRFVLGTPLIEDPLHPNRWDYVYRHVSRGELAAQRRLTVLFEDEVLKSVEGDVVAAEPAAVAPIVKPASQEVKP